jgi:YesN/AraC family two-component response regulator
MLQLKHTAFHVSPKNQSITPKRNVMFYEVELYTEGEGFSFINDEKYPHKCGNLLISVPGDTRYSISTFSCHSFKFLPNGDNEFESAVKALRGVHYLQNHEELVPFFKKIYSFSVKDKSGLYLDAAMRNVIALIHNWLSPEMVTDEKISDSMQAALTYISQNLTAKISLSDIAASAYMSPSYFQKKFKKCFNGISPANYILKKRIEYSKGVICDNSLSMERVAELSGFSSRAYFDVCFKKETGVTPAAYRKLLNKGMF